MKAKAIFVFVAVQAAPGGGGGAAPGNLLVRILSFPCSLRVKCSHVIGWGILHPSLDPAKALFFKIHKISNIGILVLLKSENKLNIVVYGEFCIG